jgi:hypothetical protein
MTVGANISYHIYDRRRDSVEEEHNNKIQKSVDKDKYI